MTRPARLALPVAVVASLLVAGPLQAADPTTADCLSAHDNSLSLRGQRKLRAARAELLVCAAANCPADIRNECIRRVADVNTAMPTVVFEAKDASGNDVSAVKATMDGQPLIERLEGTAISLDPGEHSFTFEAPGQLTIEKHFVIVEGVKERREVIVFGTSPAGASAMPAAGPAPAPALRPTPEPQPKGASRGLGAQRVAALVAGGVGVVGLAVGAVFALDAMSKKNDATAACPSLCADQRGVDLWNDAGRAGDVSTIAFVVGGIALAGGAVLWFTAKAPSDRVSGAAIGVGPGLVELRSEW